MSNILECLSQNVIIDKEKCVFCGKCVEACILDNLRLKLAPCRKACPLGLNCQGYAQLIVRGDEEKALSVIGENLPFPGILGRICHHPCETACNRNEVDGQPVALRVLKRYLADNYTFTHQEPEQAKDYKVAIIGGGPAGMMAAYTLRQKGYKTFIYEAGKQLGGMLTNCIPEYRLPKVVAHKEIKVLEQMGVQIFYNTVVGKDVSLTQLTEEYDAVIIATGAPADKKLGLAGEDAVNVYSALEFLKRVRENHANVQPDRRVLIIGGGNTAVDAAQTAYRLGAEEVRIVCLENREAMPAFSWEVAEALKEGIVIENGWGPEHFVIEDGRVTGVEFKRCLSVFDKNGKFSPLFSEGEKQSFPADTVIIAIGQNTDLAILEGTDIKCNGSYIERDPVTMQTNVEKVFVAGDITLGNKSVVDAMAQGREAAESVDRYLRKLPLAYGRDALASCDIDFSVDFSAANLIPRVQPSQLEGEKRRSFAETEEVINQEQALLEAKRCLSCGEPWGKFRTCWSCLPCEVECPEKALRIEIPYLMR
ncbi:MAG: 4Fe-4S ferredoxin, iron-sulfur binding [Peptococcaceae bacterium]|jgi:NADPH-dependent glutamate synthase beta subunit-like oxidoreductase/ferredoxin|nr:4Fe-4S ferredoxin, iron-sulfur binding [Peptococcaceae bacterium]